MRKLNFIIMAGVAVVPAALAWLAMPMPQGAVSTSGGYAVLVFKEAEDAGIDLMEIHNKLEKENIKGVISASNQYAYLNCFSSLDAVSLDEWFSRVEAGDPRNDGYAKKALEIFDTDGERRVFIPSPELAGFGIDNPRSYLERILDRDDFKLILPSYRKSVMPSIIIFLISAALFLLLARKISQAAGDNFLKFYAIFLLPPLTLLTREGAAGFALCAVLLAVFQIARPAMLRFITALDFCGRDEIVFLFVREMRQESRKTAALSAIAAIIIVVSPVSVFAVLGDILCVLLAFTAIVWAEAQRGRVAAHRHYVFVPIRSASYKTKRFPALPLPFLAGTIAAFVATLLVPGSQAQNTGTFSVKNIDSLPSRADFENHFEFQQKFSFTNLNSDGAEYLRYEIDANGLIKAIGAVETQITRSENLREAPRWTLEPLIPFLRRQDAPFGGSRQTGGQNAAREFAVLILALCLYLPFVIRFVR